MPGRDARKAERLIQKEREREREREIDQEAVQESCWEGTRVEVYESAR